ncbi:TonB-dependent siderophore receptor [Endozoicomonas sp. SCSIO W0465]|uniref:TonB-dependent receptor plug domain-containing protein n=1 Tax=Endozoicomonas sp. SCSIO W0465 TaxID=2918516 RepID=UPI0020754FB3|nr:TonB-dependent receptor [Endozoicomonas sp. SCSIO W0465]USE36320.1 TonB-dependent receptor [Endozoicomonas sp. SCSIO W0465]
MKPLNHSLLLTGILSSFITSVSLQANSDLAVVDNGLLDLSLEELISLDVPDVTSVSKRKQRLMDSPAAVFVITDEDILRSGVTSIPEALRMVPGMQVARLNSNTWSISTRGFNYIFANKLLVLIDGRTVYSPLFSGVNWDVQDTMLEDIARIEVIRGPGAALWGANAVNGVINIITKHAADTQSGLLSTGFGSEEKAFAAYRYGGELGDDGYYRAFFKTFNRDALATANGSDANDDWQLNRAGLRADWRTETGAEASLQSEIYDGTTRPALKIFNADTFTQDLITHQNRDQRGGHLIGNYKHYLADGSHFTLKGYYDRYENYDYRVTEKRDIGDLEFQHQILPRNNHDIIWGMGYRLTKYNLSGMNNITMGETRRTDQLYSAFIQDHITLTPEWALTLSSRFEHNDFTGYEVQPNASLTWKISDQQTLWLKAASALKTPSISETSVTSRGITFLREDDSPIPTIATLDLLAISGNKQLESEKLFALEVGYREQFNNRLLFDITAFFNQYKDLLVYIDQTDCLDGTSSLFSVCSYNGGSPNIEGDIVLEYPTTFSNELTANTFGLELTTDWQAKPWWKLQFNYSFLGVDAFSDKSNSPITNDYLKGNENLLETLSANHTANIRSYMNLPNQWYLDFWVRYMDNLKNARVKAYTALDVRVAKKIGKDLEFSLTGKNLFDKQRLEFSEVFSGLGETEVQESWYLQLRWQY